MARSYHLKALYIEGLVECILSFNRMKYFQVLQPHYSHVPLTLQFMMDYNLQGMNFLNLRLAKFRQFAKASETAPTNDEESLRKVDKSERKFDASNVPSHLLLPEHVARVSSCELEIDGLAPDILNTNSSLLSHSLLAGSAPAR